MRAALLAFLTVLLGARSYAGCPSNPLEMHAAFFDINHDGKVEYWETVASLERLGVGFVERQKFAILLHTVVFFKNGGDSAISISGLAKTGRHEGDTGIFSSDGAFDLAAFQRFFDGFDADRSGAINTKEVETAIAANKKERGEKGAGAAAFELPILIGIAGDRTDTVNGAPVKAISKERLQKFYQGTLLYELVGDPLPSCVPEVRAAALASKQSGALRNYSEKIADTPPANWDLRGN
ncbi:MAG: caleosin family protein [Elusimicrobiota bacterium]